MSTPAPPEDLHPAIRAAFLERWNADADVGIARTRLEYQRMYPGYEVVVGAEFDLLNSPEPSSAPRRFGRYVVVDTLGRGGQGTVYLALDERLGRRVALKVLRGGPAADPESRSRFLREMEVTAKLDLPGACPVFDAGGNEDWLWIALRFIEGETLAARLNRGGRVADDGPGVASFFAKIARTLADAHRLGVIHRDVKPANIMIDGGGSPVLLDFGMAQAENAAGVALTATGNRCGTPAYMAPEQVRPDLGPIDGRTDVFALGATLLEALSGRRAFEETSRDATLAAVLKADPTRNLPRLPPGSAPLVRIARRALRKRPEDRYAGATELAEDLERVARGQMPRTRLAPFTRRQRRIAAVALPLFVGVAWLGTIALRPGDHEPSLDTLRAEAADLRTRAAAFGAPNPRSLGPNGEYARWQSDWSRLRAAGHAFVRSAPAVRTAVPADENYVAAVAVARVHAERLRRAHACTADAEAAAAEAFAERLSILRALDSSTEIGLDDPSEARLRECLTLSEELHRLEVDAARVDALAKEAAEEARRIAGVDADLWRAVFRALAADGRFQTLPHERPRGLVPLGADGRSQLQEFALAASGKVPTRTSAGSLQLGPESALVFVLVPGGKIRIGAEATNRNSPRYDADAGEAESPVVEITIRPYLIAKTETTQAMFMRVMGESPSTYYEGWTTGGRTVTLCNPVESVSWREAVEFCRRLGARLPSEAEWEAAARGRSEGRWPHGDLRRDAAAAINLADRSQEVMGLAADWRREPDIDDGFCRHAPVGALAPNSCGLVDMAGNVAEWCADPAVFRQDEFPLAEDSGLRTGGHPFKRVLRGGGWRSTLMACRLTARRIEHADHRSDDAGFRIALSWK